MEEIIKQRKVSMDALVKAKSNLEKIEYQISLMPFYQEMIELKESISEYNKTISNIDKEIFEYMKENSMDNIKDVNTVTTFIIEKSSKPSVEIYDMKVLPKECFIETVDSKTNIGKLIKKYESEGKELPGAKFTYSESLKII